MKKAKRRTRKATYWGMAANTRPADWGFGPVAGKGGRTHNYDETVTMAEACRLCCRSKPNGY